MFDDTALKGPDSPYTSYVTKLHQITRGIPINAFELLYKQVRSWYSRQKPGQHPKCQTRCKIEPYDTSFTNWSKVKDGVHYLPCPFRALPGSELDENVGAALHVRPQIGPSAEGTTYHTYPVDVDPTKDLIKESRSIAGNPVEHQSHLGNIIFHKLLDYSLFTAVYVESELFSKISGRDGCFWSKYTRCGIAWKRPNSNSLNYHVCFYVRGVPPMTCGKWSIINEEHNIYRGPTFLLANANIQHAITLPHRFVCQVVSTLAYCRANEVSYIVQRLLMQLATLRGSSWQTSALAGDFRFITLCAVSGSGDVPSLIDKIPARVKNYLSFCDAYLLRLIKDFAERYDGSPMNTTPILGLPMRFIAVEKDWPNAFMWHMRKTDHATNCMKKLIKGIHQEIDQRQAITNSLDMQCRYLEDAAVSNKTQGDFDDLMASMPHCAYYNHVVFLGMAWRTTRRLDMGKRQEPVGINLHSLYTDHHGVYLEHNCERSGLILSPSPVSTNIDRMLNKYNEIDGIHRLLLRLSETHAVEQIYLMHEKDSKSKDREIAQMHAEMRVMQYMSESLVKIYTDADPIDMMQAPK
jgi:hypothetical protein